MENGILFLNSFFNSFNFLVSIRYKESKRVFGSLMLTRSIGDREMKNYGVFKLPFENI